MPEENQHTTEITIEDLDRQNKALVTERDLLATRAKKAETRVTELEARVIRLETEKLQGSEPPDMVEHKLLVTRAEKAETRVTELEDRVHEMEVDSLVGFKITPAEKPAFLRALKLDRSLFDDLVAQKRDMHLTTVITAKGAENGIGQPITGDDEPDAFTLALKGA